MSTGDRAYLRKHVRHSKYDPLLEEVEVLDVNPQYAHVRLPSGVESTVSIRDLAPCGDSTNHSNHSQQRSEQQEHPQRQEQQQHAPTPPQQLEPHSTVTLDDQGAAGSSKGSSPIPVPENDDAPVALESESPEKAYVIPPRRSSRSNKGQAPLRLIEEK